MKIYILLFVTSILFMGCDKNNTPNNNNPNLPNYTFSIDINLTLPSYNALNFAGNGITITQQGAGIRGVFLFNTGSGFTAFDMACPNQSLTSCSTMTLSGIDAICPCDSKKYSLYTGLSSGQQYPLKVYRTEVVGSNVRIFN